MIKLDAPSGRRAARGRYAVITVCVRIPDDADLEDVAGYVDDAVRSHVGGLNLADPMADFDRDSVMIRARRQSQPARWN